MFNTEIQWLLLIHHWAILQKQFDGAAVWWCEKMGAPQCKLSGQDTAYQMVSILHKSNDYMLVKYIFLPFHNMSVKTFYLWRHKFSFNSLLLSSISKCMILRKSKRFWSKKNFTWTALYIFQYKVCFKKQSTCITDIFSPIL